MNTECPICAEAFNKSTKSPIKCEIGDCDFQACKSCIRQYLLTTTGDACCMQCKSAWTQAFLVKKLNRTFITSSYNQHRKELLTQSEISRIPDTMEAAERFKKIKEEQDKAEEIRLQIINLKQEINNLIIQQNTCHRNIRTIRYGNPNSTQEKKTFLMACPNDNCRGFLSTQYKCGICKLFSCPKCIEVIGESKDDNQHVCDPNSVASAELIKKDTRPCPSCASRIFKISGCDQIWCTKCHVAFSWNTGKIETGVIHNPHYYEFQRNQNNGVAPRVPGDNPCEEFYNLYQIRNSVYNKLPNQEPLINILDKIHRFIQHNRHVELPQLRHRIDELQNNEHLRILYIIGQIDREQLARDISLKDTKRRKFSEIIHLYEIYVNVGIDLFQIIVNSTLVGNDFTIHVQQQIKNYNNLREYCNTQFSKISATYNSSVPITNQFWHSTNEKFNLSTLDV